jgi:hypothetical protein
MTIWICYDFASALAGADPMWFLPSAPNVGSRKPRIRQWHPSRWPCCTLYPQKVVTNFFDKRRSLDRYSSLADKAKERVLWFRCSKYKGRKCASKLLLCMYFHTFECLLESIPTPNPLISFLSASISVNWFLIRLIFKKIDFTADPDLKLELRRVRKACLSLIGLQCALIAYNGMI